MYSQKKVPTNFLFNMNPPRVSNYQSKLSTRCTHSTIVFLSLSPQKNLCVCVYIGRKKVCINCTYIERELFTSSTFTVYHTTRYLTEKMQMTHHGWRENGVGEFNLWVKDGLKVKILAAGWFSWQQLLTKILQTRFSSSFVSFDLACLIFPRFCLSKNSKIQFLEVF